MTLPCFPESTLNTCPVICPLQDSLAKNTMLFATAEGGTGLPRAVLRLISQGFVVTAANLRCLAVQPVLLGVCFALATKLDGVDWTGGYGVDSVIV